MNLVGVDLHKNLVVLCVVDQQRNVLQRKRLSCADVGSITAFFERMRPFHASRESAPFRR